jgi:hypothetical protein
VVQASTSALDVEAVMTAVRAFDTGGANLRTGKYEDAVRDFEEAYAALKVPQLLHNVGASLYMQGKRDGDAAAYRRAAETYTRYLAIDPIAPGVASAITAINGEVARLEAGGARDTPSPEIQRLPDPELRGFVLLISEPPGATVYVDDVTKGPMGTTPWAGTLEGKHTIHIAKPGLGQADNEITFDPHKFLLLKVELASKSK